MFHRFQQPTGNIDLPAQFTFPFYYEPHELCRLAADQAQHYLDDLGDWFTALGMGSDGYEYARGKMFGVLVVRDKQGELGFLAAYSGVITGGQKDSYFVPPVFDVFTPGNRYESGSQRLAEINHEIRNIQQNPELNKLKTQLNQMLSLHSRLMEDERLKQITDRKKRKAERERLAKELNAERFEHLVSQHKQTSIHTKFMIREYSLYLKEKENRLKEQLEPILAKLVALKKERKQSSQQLQEWIFSQYRFLNANGEHKDALELFQDRKTDFPPSGTGDCAAPKLLQFAYQHGYEPVAMAEFWYGEPLKSRIRKHKYFYPACRAKCEPILEHMLQGLDVEPNPVLKNPAANKRLEIIYEDDDIIAIDKPAEFLSVEGINIKDSVERRLRKKHPDAGPMIVHRLDMSTSGIMILSKNLDAHRILQEQFENRKVQKKYTAVLDGVLPAKSGEISLPLRVDLDNRPYQMVDHGGGKPALTRFEVIEVSTNKTKVHFYPITGRTHQLRVHAAHPDGLNCPIVGDDLYGKRSDRLLLHATTIEFAHPRTGKQIVLSTAVPACFEF